MINSTCQEIPACVPGPAVPVGSQPAVAAAQRDMEGREGTGAEIAGKAASNEVRKVVLAAWQLCQDLSQTNYRIRCDPNCMYTYDRERGDNRHQYLQVIDTPRGRGGCTACKDVHASPPDQKRVADATSMNCAPGQPLTFVVVVVVERRPLSVRPSPVPKEGHDRARVLRGYPLTALLLLHLSAPRP